jgi:hypothetical protein
VRFVSVIGILAIAGCTPTVIVDSTGYTGIEPEPTPDGIVALGLNGRSVDFADVADGRLPISGSLYRSSEGPVQLWLTSIAGLDLRAAFPGGSSLAATVPLTDIFYATDIAASVPQDASVGYGIGPDGGTARLTAISPQDGGYRIRGEFDTQICPNDANDRDEPCYRLEGRFAFDEATLPEGADTGTLLQSGG